MKECYLKPVMTACLLLASASVFAQANQRVERLIQQIRSTTNPRFDTNRSGDMEYMKQHREAVKQAIRQRGTLITALYKEDPENLVLMEFLPKRWMELELLGDTEEELAPILQGGIKETENLLLPPPGIMAADLWPEESWFQICRYWRARLTIRLNRGNWPAQIAVAKEYITETPSHTMTHSDILLQAAFQAPSQKQAAEAYRMIVEKYPEDHIVPTVRGFLKRIEGVGQPASFSLIDAKTKKEVKTESYKGKVLFLDFFRLEPEMLKTRIEILKELKAAHPQDLVIISVCLDMATGNAAKTLEAKVLDWAQQAKVDWIISVPGERAQPDFLTAWHIATLPEAFIINKEGVLVKLGFGLDLSREAKALLKP